MKKIITTILVAALSISALKADFTFDSKGFITITSGADLTLTITRDFGGNKGFGYYQYDPETGVRGDLISIDATQGDTFTISGLAAGESIGFYIEHAGQGTIYGDALGKKDGYNLSSLGIDETGFESMNIKFQGNNNGVQFGISHSSPSGQPMPGAIASLLFGALALGSFIFIRRKRA